MERRTTARRLYEGSILEEATESRQPEERKHFPSNTGALRDEIIRILARIRPQLSSDDRVLLLTSVTQTEGTSELASESAFAFSKLEARPTLLVDTAILSPSLHQRFGLPGSPGLAEVLTGRCSLAESVRRISDRQLHVLPAGNTNLGPAALFASPQLPMIMQLLRTEYHFVILSVPPVLTDVSASLLSSVADGVVLVVSSGSQGRTETLAAQNELRGIKAKMLGVVLYTPEQDTADRELKKSRLIENPSGPKPVGQRRAAGHGRQTLARPEILLAAATLVFGLAGFYALVPGPGSSYAAGVKPPLAVPDTRLPLTVRGSALDTPPPRPGSPLPNGRPISRGRLVNSKVARKEPVPSRGKNINKPSVANTDLAQTASDNANAVEAQNTSELVDHASEQHRTHLPSVTAIRHWSTPNYTRVAIDVESDVQFAPQRLSHPDRIFFDLRDTNLASTLVGKTFDVHDGFLKKIRVAQFQPGRTRVVLEVDNLSDYDAFLLPNPYRIVIDVYGKSGKTARTNQPKNEIAK
jgi:capsular exopolysaccharide synthesis family protein